MTMFQLRLRGNYGKRPLTVEVIKTIEPLTDESRVNVFVVDDSL